MRAVILLFLLYANALGEDKSSGKGSTDEPKLPRCPHVNPYKNLEKWMEYRPTNCNYTSVEEDLTEEQKTYQTFGLKSFAFDSLASDRLGIDRNPGVVAHKLCANTTFDAEFSTSIVIVHHNECLSVLLRMLTGIFERTPEHMLHEVILYEDASEEEHK
ncbi:unnamed protein product, partial [Strongylus vulgaris]